MAGDQQKVTEGVSIQQTPAPTPAPTPLTPDGTPAPHVFTPSVEPSTCEVCLATLGKPWHIAPLLSPTPKGTVS
jgi:hypothetical protein